MKGREQLRKGEGKMRDQYDFSKGVKNPYAAILKKQAAVNIDADTAEYFKRQATETCIPYQKLINFYLAECVKNNMQHTWTKGKSWIEPGFGVLYDAAQGAAFFISVSAIDFRLVGALENIIDAHAVKIGEQNERLRGRDTLAGCHLQGEFEWQMTVKYK